MTETPKLCPWCGNKDCERTQSNQAVMCNVCQREELAERWENAYCWKLLDERDQQIKVLREALEDARTYLEERGIRTKGTIGRTKILPSIDKALAETGEK